MAREYECKQDEQAGETGAADVADIREELRLFQRDVRAAVEDILKTPERKAQEERGTGPVQEGLRIADEDEDGK